MGVEEMEVHFLPEPRLPVFERAHLLHPAAFRQEIDVSGIGPYLVYEETQHLIEDEVHR